MKLDYKRTVFIGFAFMSILAFWQFYDQVIPYILKYRFTLGDTATNVIMAIDNVLAVFMLPLFGILSDRTRTRLGKRTPYILFGTIAASGLLILLAFFEEKLFFPGFIVTLIVLLVVMAVYRSPAVAYMPDVTEKPLRSKANAVINLVGYIGGIFAAVAMMVFLKSKKDAEGNTIYDNSQSFMTIFIIIAVFMLVSVAAMVLLVKENRLPHVDDGPETVSEEHAPLKKEVKISLALILLSVLFWFMAYNAVTTSFSRYCHEKWGDFLDASSGYLLVATLAAIASFLPLGFLSSRMGRKKTVLIGIAVMTACYGAVALTDKKSVYLYVLFALVGVAWAAINVNSYPMVVEMGKGSDVGKYTGLYYTFSMAAQIMTPVISGYVIEHTRFSYGALFPYAVIFSGASFITMLFVRHGDNKPSAKDAMLQNLAGGED